ncbi:MAG TPA: winged helix-turn-helix domain-containing protein, partial [Candidatus Thermoplasmatota archaeon]|nr:winged helix-turn-helix domain-containing protein [Candidatus Thermoplasmatota archaeon]
MPDDELVLDAELVKVLASDTRLDLLALLGKRRMTLSEMARAVKLSKATVLEHLEKLLATQLVRRRDDHRLWVYYELTR